MSISNELLEEAWSYVLQRIDSNREVFVDVFPSPNSEKSRYEKWSNYEWTPGFWTGLLYLAYEKTNDTKYIDTLKTLLPTFEQRLIEDTTLDTHDIGFIYTLSTYPGYLLFNNTELKEITMRSAKRLMQRYNETIGVIQAWGNINNPSEQGRIIIDSLLNMPLLYTMSSLSGDERYRSSALKHCENAKNFLVRPDNSTYHTYYFDVITGLPIKGKTAQGKNDDSTWGRGQAWAVLGFAINYYHTKDVSLLETAIKCADYYLSELPEDGIPYWDLSIKSGEEPRDSSAASILVCGLLEIIKYLPVTSDKRLYYQEEAEKIIVALITDYLVKDDSADGVLLHGTYSVPHNNGVDECCIWGDYFFVEALTRMTRVWNSYWE